MHAVAFNRLLITPILAGLGTVSTVCPELRSDGCQGQDLKPGCFTCVTDATSALAYFTLSITP